MDVAVARDAFACEVANVVEATISRAHDRHSMRQTVMARADRGEAFGFLTKADLGLYCIAWILAPGEMEDGDLGQIAHDLEATLDARRYDLKKALDVAGLLAFGAHEAVPRDPPGDPVRDPSRDAAEP